MARSMATCSAFRASLLRANFFHLPVPKTLLDIAVSLTHIGNKSLQYQMEFRIGDRQVATGKITSVCCRVDPGQPMVSVPLPGEIKEKLGQYLVESS